MKILHIIPSLEVGGSERFLARLSGSFARDDRIEQVVFVIGDDGKVGDDLRRQGVAVQAFKARSVLGNLLAALRLARYIRRYQPDIVQSWLYRADAIASIAKFWNPQARLVWNLRCTDARVSIAAALARRFCAAISSISPDAIVACGWQAKKYHARLGYREDKITVIGNGYVFREYIPDRVRRIRALPIIVGAAGRFDFAKGYDILLSAINELIREHYDVVLRIAGRGCERGNDELLQMISAHGLSEHVELLGEIDDMEEFYDSIDIFCLSSRSEGFPNVLIEAMSAGVPAVTTDAGDAMRMVRGHAVVVTRDDALSLKRGLKIALDQPDRDREERGRRGAAFVREHYSLDAVSGEYLDLYRRIAE